jgi:hypothetical protein
VLARLDNSTPASDKQKPPSQAAINLSKTFKLLICMGLHRAAEMGNLSCSL